MKEKNDAANSAEGISLDGFKQAVTRKKIIIATFIHLNLIAGPLLFLLVVLILGKNDSLISEDPTMTYVNIGLTVITFLAALVIPWIMLKFLSGNAVSAEEYVAKIQSSLLVRLALLEGSAFFGAVILFLGKGYINLISFIPLLMFGAMYFPTRKLFYRLFITYYKKDPDLLLEL